MILSLAVALAHAEDCVPARAAVLDSVLTITGMGFPDPLAIRFVSDATLGERLIAGSEDQRVELDAIPLGRLGVRSVREAVIYAGAVPQRDGTLRLRGGEPRVYVDGIKLRSDLE